MLFKICTSGLICVKTKLETHTHAEIESACLLLKLHQWNNLPDPQIPELHQTHLHEDIEGEGQAIPSSKCYSHCQCHQGVNTLGWPVQGVRYLILTPCHSHGLLGFAIMSILPKFSINHTTCLWGWLIPYWTLTMPPCCFLQASFTYNFTLLWIEMN